MAAREPRKSTELDELARLNRDLEQRSKNGRVEYNIEKNEVIKTEHELPKVFNSSAQNSSIKEVTHKNVVHVKEAPILQSIVCHEPIKREVEFKREINKPKVTVQRIEENKRTEEVERRIIRRERRHKSHRTKYSHGNRTAQEAFDWTSRGARSNSAVSRYGLGNGEDFYQHYSSSRHGVGDNASDRFFNQNRDARYGSLSNSIKRSDLKYVPNGDIRENSNYSNNNTKRFHKSYSTRDVFHDNNNYYHNGHNNGNNYFVNEHQPLVEFPQTLPRHNGHYYDGAPIPPPHRNNIAAFEGSGRLTKSRSYADWDEGRGIFGSSIRRYDDDMSRLENEFRDSLLIKLPTNGGNMNEKDYHHQVIPGGYETYEREIKASNGKKINRDGHPTNFHESFQEQNFKRETQR